jgi:hypothetical protein
MPGLDDATYYAELEAGAEFLAGNSADPGERAAHRWMAGLYRGRARDSGAPPAGAKRAST